MTLADVFRAHLDEDCPPQRFYLLQEAAEKGSSPEILALLLGAVLVRRKDSILLPPHRYEGLSRGRGWCRKGKGENVTWGDREDNGYRVGRGRWIVGGSDGFTRKGETAWDVFHVVVGAETWTIAT